MARTEVHATLKRIRRQLAAGHRSEVNLLSAAISDTTETIPLALEVTAALIPGAVLGIGLELMRVKTVGTSDCTVIRGWLDSTAAAHASGDEVQISPRFSLLDLHEAMIAEVNSWGPQIYRVESTELTVGLGLQAVELPAEFIGAYGICRVARKYSTDTTRWPDLPVRVTRGEVGWTGAPTSGILLRMIDPVDSGTVFVLAAMPITLTDPDLTDDLVTDHKIPESMIDVLEMGVKLRVAHDAEYARASRQAQDDSRRTEESPAQGFTQPMQFGVALYRNRVQQEVNKLRAQYPIRIR